MFGMSKCLNLNFEADLVAATAGTLRQSPILKAKVPSTASKPSCHQSIPILHSTVNTPLRSLSVGPILVYKLLPNLPLSCYHPIPGS